MKLDQPTKDKLQEGINNLIATEFPWCKEQIIRSRELVPIEDAELWMRYRNAMDRLLSVQRGINFGEFPSSNLVTEDIEAEDIRKVEITDPNPNEILQYSAYLFRNCGVEAWVQAAETLVGLLEIRINSFSYHGDKAKANSYLKEALKLQAKARLARSSSHLISVEYYKKSADKANSGLDILEKINPVAIGGFWTVISIVVAMGFAIQAGMLESFWIAIGILIVAIIALLHSYSII